MTLTPRQAKILLALTGQSEGSIRVGNWTGLETLTLMQALKAFAETNNNVREVERV